MRLSQILINEGRKEDLRKKYTEKFKEYPETLDFILGISDLADTNFKYADFVLKTLHPSASDDDVEHIIDLVKDFDRFQQSLEVKDINKYGLYQLEDAIIKHKETSKSQQKKSFDTSGAKKIFEDKNILIVRPLTFGASCKYGAGTRWCTTMAGQPSYFESHTSKEQALYYVILKNFNRDNKFYKIAIHMKPNEVVWYDSTDERMTKREIEVFNLGAPKVIETIKNDYTEFLESKSVGFFKKLFNWENYYFADVSHGFRGTDKKIGIEIKNAELITDMPNHAVMKLYISVDEENIDEYLVMIVYNVGQKINFEIGYSGDDTEIQPEFDFGVENVSTHFQLSLEYLSAHSDENIKNIFSELCWTISKQVVYRMKVTPEFMDYILEGKPSWFPNRMSYGYTFKRGKGMIKDLINYLDAGNRGTKLDFLVHKGILDQKEINGKPYYSKPNQNNWQIGSAYRGQHSGFFNSAKLAGIIDYDKKGNQFIMKPGPNYEKYKSGDLKAL